jgi:hypothetical protein
MEWLVSKIVLIRAAKLDAHLYEEVEADKGAMGQAMAVVVFSSIAGGVAYTASAGLGGILIGTIAALVAWYIWAFLTYLIGTKLLPEPQTKADVGELLRTIGFSSSPGLIRVLGIIPFLRGPVFLVAGVWMLVAMVRSGISSYAAVLLPRRNGGPSLADQVHFPNTTYSVECGFT